MKYGKDIKFDIYKLDKKYEIQINEFSCGNGELDKYLREKALPEMEQGQSVTKIILEKESGKILAYYSLAAASIVMENHNHNYFSPAVEVKMYAVADELHGLAFSDDVDDGTFSENLFSLIIGEIYQLSEKKIGIANVILYSVPHAVDFYTKIGFESFEEYMMINNDRYLNGCKPMWLSL